MDEDRQDGAARRRKPYRPPGLAARLVPLPGLARRCGLPGRVLAATVAMAMSAALCTVAAGQASAVAAGPTAAPAASGWTVQASGTSQHLYGVTCPTTSLCFAVGAGGTILQGNGSSWTSQPSGVTDIVHAVACPAANLCLAVGSGGLLLRYAGSGWARLPSPTIADLSRIACPSTALCFAAGGAGTIVRLTGGGNTAALVASGTPLDLDAVSCASASFCVAVGDHGAITQYDGTSWRASPAVTGGVLYGVACPDTSFCLAVGEHGTVLGYHGTGWSAQPATSSTARINDVACPSASRCYAVDQQGTALTYDAGTWTSQPTGTGQDLRRIACPSTALCFAVGLSGMIARYAGPAWIPQPSGITDDLSAVACPNASECFASGGTDGQFLRWNGLTWTQVDDDFGPTGIACPGMNLCFAVAGPLIQEYNGGTWADVSVSGGFPQQDFTAVACASASYCAAVGDYGTVAIYNGSGWTLHSGSRNSSVRLRGVSCQDTSACLAVGSDGQQDIVETIPGGSIQALQPNYPETNVACAPGGSPCFLVGPDILQYRNGNWADVTNWSPQAMRNLLGVSCPGSSECFAVGGYDSSSGLLTGPGLVAEFDGSSWAIAPTPTASALEAVSCAGTAFCMAVGANGTTAAYAPAPATPTIVGPENGAIAGIPVVFGGQASDGTTVSVYLEGTTFPACTTEVSNGQWSCVTSGFPAGNQLVVAVASDLTGQASSLPVSLAVTPLN